MTTHRQAWKQRAGVVVALASSALLALPATPALADAPKITNIQASPNSVDAGGTVQVSYSLNFQGNGSADIQVSSNNSKLSCTAGCSASRVDQSGQRSATFKYNTAGTSNETATITIKATDNGLIGGSENGSTSVTLNGRAAPPPQNQTVAEVSGKVADVATGAGISGASVGLTDAQGRTFGPVTTGSSGTFKFTGTAAKPIAPGQLQVGARKGDSSKIIPASGSAGQKVTGLKIVLTGVAASASPSATEEVPTEDPALPSDGAAEPSDSGAAGDSQAKDDAGSSSGLGSMVLIIVGGLLVALGVGAIVLLWMRRKENNGDDADDEDGNAAAQGGRGGGYRGGPDATRVGNRAGAGADPTMVARSSLADAPTMMHNRPLVDDEFPDPYGAPLPPPQGHGPQTPPYGGGGQQGWDDGGYGSAGPPTQADYNAGPAGAYGAAPGSGAGGYGAAPASGAGGYGAAPGSGAGGYGNAPGSGAGGYGAQGAGGYGNAPGSGAGGYGARDYAAPNNGAAGPGYPPPPPGGGGYGEQQRYDEPTGRYTGGGADEYAPPPADPYETGYGQPGSSRGGYGQDPPYGQAAPGPEAPAGGYGSGGGSGGGYGAGPSAGSGYDAGEGYGQQAGGYDQRGGYGAGPAAEGGYDQPTTGGGYDDRGGYGRVPEQRGDEYGQQGGGYDQGAGGYYDEQQAKGDRTRVDGPPPQGRSGRRTVDWLDD